MSEDRASLQQDIEALYTEFGPQSQKRFETVFPPFVEALNGGKIRSAERSDGGWCANEWVKKGILLGFRQGKLKDYSGNSGFSFFDKDTFPLRPLHLPDGVRVVPGGTSVRNGCYLAPGVVIMPPAYVNVGAWIDEGTMVDSHVLVGSCAQIGRRVHLSAGTQIGGVLEPVGALPVIIEDDVMIGGNSGVYEGTIVEQGAVIGAGTILTSSIPVYDLVEGTIRRGSKDQPLVIPKRAVVVPGSRPVKNSGFAALHALHLACAVIVKYRDDKTDSATALESALR